MCLKPNIDHCKIEKQMCTRSYTNSSTTTWRRDHHRFFLKNLFPDFVTLWVSTNTYKMTFSTILSYNPTDKVPDDSVDHTESLWTLIVTSISLTSFGDLNFCQKSGFITILELYKYWRVWALNYGCGATTCWILTFYRGKPIFVMIDRSHGCLSCHMIMDQLMCWLSSFPNVIRQFYQFWSRIRARGLQTAHSSGFYKGAKCAPNAPFIDSHSTDGVKHSHATHRTSSTSSSRPIGAGSGVMVMIEVRWFCPLFFRFCW